MPLPQLGNIHSLCDRMTLSVPFQVYRLEIHTIYFWKLRRQCPP